MSGGDMLLGANVMSTTERIVVRQKTVDASQTITTVTVVAAGPQGPPGAKGEKGDTGEDTGVIAEAMMITHVNSPAPHPVYDDMVDLATLLENGLI